MQRDIVIFSPVGRSGSPAHGGITPVVCHLANAFVDQGLKIELITFSPGDARALLPPLRTSIGITNLGVSTKAVHLLKLARHLMRSRPRSLLAAGHRANLLSARCKRLLPVPTRVFLGVHNRLGPALAQMSRGRRRRRIGEIRRNYPAADGVICVSAGLAEELRDETGLAPERTWMIHNPILSDELVRSAQAPSGHPWLRRGQPPVILGAGRLTRQKDFPTLVRAFALVSARVDSRLLIIGEGADRPMLERLVGALGLSARVELPGFVENPMRFMRESALFVLSSAWEGFGNVLVEAMAVGTPVVSTDCPSGPREILLDGGLGRLVPTGDPRALAEAILATLGAPIDPTALARRAADFHADLVARRYCEVLLESDDPRSGQLPFLG